ALQIAAGGAPDRGGVREGRKLELARGGRGVGRRRRRRTEEASAALVGCDRPPARVGAAALDAEQRPHEAAEDHEGPEGLHGLIRYQGCGWPGILTRIA